ncbi:hypothetical protein JCM15765_42140 [Paradesulfitobacterium aromaticivorans]
MITLNKGIRLELLAGRVIYFCLGLLTISVISLRLIDVEVKNIELVDRGLYTVITEKGPVNVGPEDVLRIERTYTKAAVTGSPVELDKIYTKQGFIYTSSSDPFSKNAQTLINSVDYLNSVDYYGLNVWQHPNVNLKSIQPYAYAIGTPKRFVPLVFFLLSVQTYCFTIGAISLLILIFPVRFKVKKTIAVKSRRLNSEFQSGEEKLEVLAK